MGKRLIERIALEFTNDPNITAMIVKAIERIDAERSKSAAGAQYRTREQDDGQFGEWHTVGYQPQGPESSLLEIRPLFLSPAPIPEGMCLVPIDHPKALDERDRIIEEQRSALKNLHQLLTDITEYVETPPDRSCSCHISPPCSDCEVYSHLRGLLEDIKIYKDAQ